MLRDRLLGSVLTKAIRDWLLWTVIAIVTLVAIAAMYVGIMSTAGDAYIAMMEDFPEALSNVYGTQDGTSAGMVMAAMYEIMGPIVLLTYAIGLGSSAAVGEEEAGTLPILLSSPLRRRSILAAKTIVAAVGVVVITVAMWLAVELFTTVVDMDTSRYDVFGASVQLLGMVFLFGALSLGISAWRGSSGLGIAAAAGLAVFSYFISTLLPVVEELADVARLTPWYLYSGADAIYHGIDLWLLGLAVALATALLGLGMFTLDRRDLKG
jgi:ABC-2 type transport system permease protein